LATGTPAASSTTAPTGTSPAAAAAAASASASLIAGSKAAAYPGPSWSGTTTAPLRAERRVEGTLDRLPETEAAGQAGEYLVGGQVEVAGKRAQFHFVDAEIREDGQVAGREHLVELLVLRQRYPEVIEDLPGE